MYVMCTENQFFLCHIIVLFILIELIITKNTCHHSFTVNRILLITSYITIGININGSN